MGERPFTAIAENGIELSFDSINSGSTVLGISRKTIDSLMNYPSHFSHSSVLNERFRFLESHLGLKEGSPYISPYNKPDLVGIDYNNLPLTGVHAFTEDLQPHSVYQDSSEAARLCGFGDKYYNVSRYINTRFVSCVIGGVTVKLLFTQNPLVKGGRKPVSCLNIATNLAVNYPSVNKCMEGIGLDSSKSSYMIKQYIRSAKVYNGKYLITYITHRS